MRCVLMLVTLLWCAVPSVAQVTEGERIAEVLKDGLEVSIVDDAGVKIDGRIDGFSQHMVRVARSGRHFEIPVEQIVRIERPDGVADGARAGFAVGFGSFLFAALSSDIPSGLALRFAIGQGLVSMGIGTGIDALFDNSETLYERGRRPQARVSPLVAPGVRGAAVSVSW